VNQQPVRPALFPYSGVADFRFGTLAVLGPFRKMHRHRRPCNRAAPANLQVLAGGKTSSRHVGKNFLLDAVVIFLPSMIREWSNVVENQTILLGVKLCRSVGVQRTSSRAVRIDQRLKRCFVRSLLLRARQQRSAAPLQKPSPRTIATATALHVHSHPLSLANSSQKSSVGANRTGNRTPAMPHTLCVIRFFATPRDAPKATARSKASAQFAQRVEHLALTLQPQRAQRTHRDKVGRRRPLRLRRSPSQLAIRR